MRIRSTEGPRVQMEQQISNEINITNIQGYILGGTVKDIEEAIIGNDFIVEENFIEAIDLESSGENFQKKINKNFQKKFAIICRASELLGIDFYTWVYFRDWEKLKLFEPSYNSKVKFDLVGEYSKNEFLNWWNSKKKMEQTKSLEEASERIKESSIDEILEGNGLSWGGNIDGVILDEKGQQVFTIVETKNAGVSNFEKYDPTDYLKSDYSSWLALTYFKRKYDKKVLMMTFDKDNEKNVGISEVEMRLSEAGTGNLELRYVDDEKPYENTFTTPEDAISYLESKYKVGL